MGMYSFFEYEDIEVIDWEGLEQFMKLWKQKMDKDSTIAGFTEMIKTNDKGEKYFTFEEWTNLKIISYWYDEDVLFLDMVAPYIEGRVNWTFENQDESGYVEFEEGKCKIVTGQMQWTEHKASEFKRKDMNIPEELIKLKNNNLLLRQVEE